MQPHSNQSKRRSFGVSSQFRTISFLLGLPILAMVIVLTLTTLACAFFGIGRWSASSRAAVHVRLPTLTRTPLPTLTPTVNFSAQAVPMSAEVAAPPPNLVPTPIPELMPTLTPPETDLAAATAIEDSSGGSILTALVGLNIRTGPGVDYPIIGQLVQGQSAQIIGKNPEGTWWQIVYPPSSGSLGWISGNAQYSTVTNVEGVQIAQLPPPPPPTATPSAPTLQPDAPAGEPIQAPLPPGAPTAELSQTPLPTASPAAGSTATPGSGTPGWNFAGVRLYTDQYENGLLLYGQLTNNTGSSQEILSVTGAFYNGQGQVIADKNHTYAYWPGYVIPPNAGVPFELFVDAINGAANFDLSVEAEPSSETPRRDFEFLEVNQKNEEDTYCVQGKLRNPGSQVEEYVTIAVVLYDSQDKVVNFGDYEEFGPTGGGETLTFEICIGAPNRDVARYDLWAWGQ